MPRCENLKPGDPKKYYTGNEPSPKGRGRCAGVEQIGVTARGTDNVMYVVKENKKGVKSWRKKAAKNPTKRNLPVVGKVHNAPVKRVPKQFDPPKRSPAKKPSYEKVIKEDMAALSSVRKNDNLVDECVNFGTTAARCKYAEVVTRYLKGVPYCLTRGANGVFHLGDKIALSKTIAEGEYGIAYLAEGMDAGTGSIIKVAAKVMQDNKENRLETLILNKLKRQVQAGFPQFPLMYAQLNCGKAICAQSEQDCHPNFKVNHIVMLNELAEGDLHSWLQIKHPVKQCHSAICQICVALIALNAVGYRHDDLHFGNVLYHKVPVGGCWHYVINGEDVYIQNTGQLWVLWDFGKAKAVSKDNKLVVAELDPAYDLEADMGPYGDYESLMARLAGFGGSKQPTIRETADAVLRQLGTVPLSQLIKQLSLNPKVDKVLNAKPFILSTRL
jgi:hypothetical protein